jgi:Na+/proline symporter
VLLFLSVPGDPTVPQRALAGQSTKIAKRSFLISAVLTILFGIGLVIIGAGAVVLLPNLVTDYGTAEAAFPVFIMKIFPVGIAGLGIAALLAAIMSTISAMLLVGTTHLVYDAGRSLFPKLTDKTLNKALPIAILIVGIGVTIAAMQITSLAGAMYFIFSLCGSAFLFPMLFTLYWKKASKWGITTGIASGGFLTIIMYAVGWMGPGGDPVYLGMIVSLFCCVVISLIVPGGRVDTSEMLSGGADANAAAKIEEKAE